MAQGLLRRMGCERGDGERERERERERARWRGEEPERERELVVAATRCPSVRARKHTHAMLRNALRTRAPYLSSSLHQSRVPGLLGSQNCTRAMEAIAKACALVIFGLTVSHVLEAAHEEQDLHVVGLWSGVGAIVSAAENAGLAAKPLDKFRIPGVTDTEDSRLTEDILLEAGFRGALSLVLPRRLDTDGSRLLVLDLRT